MFDSLKVLSDLLNNLSTYYEMSDSPFVWQVGSEAVKKITAGLKKLNTTQVHILKFNLDEQGILNIKRYFPKWWEQ